MRLCNRDYWLDLAARGANVRGEAKMNKRRSLRSTNIPVGRWSSDMTVGLPPTEDDAGLLALEVRFDDLVTELITAQKSSGVSGRRPGEWTRLEICSGCSIDYEADPEVVTERV